MIEVLAIAGAFGALWPRGWYIAAVVGFLGLFAGPRMVHCFHCNGGALVPNPFLTTQLVVTVLLCVAAWRWRCVRPTKLPALRRLALYSAIVVLVGSAATILDGETFDTYDFVRMTFVSSVVLLACLVLEVRLHVPLLPRATARAAVPRPDRTAS